MADDNGGQMDRDIKRNSQDAVIQARRARIEKAMLRGVSNASELAAAHGVTVNTITDDMRVIRDEWKFRNVEDAQARVAERTLQISQVIISAWASYDISRKPKTETTIRYEDCDNPKCKRGLVENEQTKKRTECPKCHGTEKMEVATIKTIDGNPGDAKFLKVALEGIKECARIEGLYPKQTLSTMKKNVLETLGPDGELTRQVEELWFEGPEDVIIEFMAGLDKLKHAATLKERRIIEAQAKAINEVNGIIEESKHVDGGDETADSRGAA